jgi:hypothetical protein
MVAPDAICHARDMKRWLVGWLVFAACSSAPPPASPRAAPPREQAIASNTASAPAPIVDQDTIRSRFRDCGDGFIGQVLDAPGARCDEVCATFGYSRCRGRAGQADFEACRAQHSVVGPCDEAFQPGWTSQCDCTNVPLDRR